MDSHFHLPSPLQAVPYSPLNKRGITLYVKRDDLIHSEVSGNKWRKLQHNFAKAAQRGNSTVLTLGGAHSNHIAATAAAGALLGFPTIGVIRGEDADVANPTLSFATGKGMRLHLISREAYRNAGSWDFMDQLKSDFGHFYFIPEGGSNSLGVMGCMDIMKEVKQLAPQRVFVACGTATTLSGMVLANSFGAALYGVSALKGGTFLMDKVAKNLNEVYRDQETEEGAMSLVTLLDHYHFGGYARMQPALLAFMRHFFSETGIKLDPVYTAKCAFAMVDMSKNLDNASGENWLLVHTGGLQGIAAMERKLGEAIYPNC